MTLTSIVSLNGVEGRNSRQSHHVTNLRGLQNVIGRIHVSEGWQLAIVGDVPSKWWADAPDNVRAALNAGEIYANNAREMERADIPRGSQG